MITNAKTHSVQNTAKIAGWLYLSLIPLGILGIIYVPATLFVAGDVDVGATISNIIANELLFRVGIVSAFLV
jgi:polynucleotide 5'-kinase involved in rRNA processing